MDLIKHGGRREGGEGKGGKVSVCQAEFPLQQPPLLSLGKLLEWCNPTHPTRAWATSTAAFCVYVQLTGAKWTALSIILISQCFSSLFSPGSHGNQHVVVWLQCCCRRIPVTAARCSRTRRRSPDLQFWHTLPLKTLLYLPCRTQAPC